MFLSLSPPLYGTMHTGKSRNDDDDGGGDECVVMRAGGGDDDNNTRNVDDDDTRAEVKTLAMTVTNRERL